MHMCYVSIRLSICYESQGHSQDFYKGDGGQLNIKNRILINSEFKLIYYYINKYIYILISIKLMQYIAK